MRSVCLDPALAHNSLRQGTTEGVRLDFAWRNSTTREFFPGTLLWPAIYNSGTFGGFLDA
jgi:hypothetical protein